jgi:opacity protein-like surface antigen
MTGRSPRSGVLLGALLAASVSSSASPVPAAPGDPEPPPTAPVASTESAAPDFFVGRPHGWAGGHGGWFLATAGGDLFDFIEKQLTLDDGDFSAPLLGLNLGFMLTPRVDLVVAFDFSQSSADSEFRDYVDQDFRPITQQTQLTEASLSVSGTYALVPRFRQVSRFASVLRRVVPYAGGGFGLLRYELVQVGDFVDFADLSIFRTTLRSSGWAPSGHVVGGVDVQLHRPWFATVEVRYTWADGKPGDDFEGFDTIDLSGTRVSAGVRYVF